MSDILDVLRERGFVQRISDETNLRAALTSGPITAYCGYDPTAPSLHAGHLLSLMLLAHLQSAGHRPVVVLGGATGLVGDPSGKTAQRRLLTPGEVAANMAALRPQFARFFDLDRGCGLLVNNADWLLHVGHLDFQREVVRHFSVNQLLQHQTYRQRLATTGLSFLEVSYVLLQAYDFLHLYRELGCTLQVGGADQWFNILAGVELIRRSAGGRAFGLVAPLLTTASGSRMGKTESGAVWLDPLRTSPSAYYQYWVNVDDADAERFLGLFTCLPMDEVRCLEAR